MFPIRDPRGRMLGFGGRVLDKGEPKYLNSPETELFHKGRELYGLHEVRLARVKLERLLVVEGYMDVVRLHQAGVQYAVATLGTATTPEHLRRAFKLVNELVFCFDGDRAGRGAAWRALQNVLPEAREGREIRFLFLPDGEDPDSLVGKEGRAAFEQRLAGAQPLSEYLLAHLGEQVELSHADGQAHLVALARPLLNTIAPGVYRELLVERLAKLVGLNADRLRPLLEAPRDATGSGGGTADHPPERATAGATTRPTVRHDPRNGRGGLVTQAIQLLLHYPSAVEVLSAAQIAALAEIAQPGVPVLHELLVFLHANQRASTAAVLERWRDRPESRRLSELAGGDVLVADAAAAGHELQETLTRLTDTNPKRARLDELIAKVDGGLSGDELQEYQLLITSLGAIGGRRPLTR
jgi:DNA primase